ncbi:hypothetical protein LptCag_2523 [Leptospirillum ferriphilum]|jgi:prevent-host-death family protein|uniref:Antitoxin n=3 Tax=Leptospirillum TaxID=179 RepID=A0A094X983_9BACT|nr:hypothetical protein LptCag_2523 [Leptospirillum ferriphilum]
MTGLPSLSVLTFQRFCFLIQEVFMKSVGAYEMKTHLSRLLEEVEKGERIVITRHGRPIAELIPYPVRNTEKIRKAILGLKEFQKSHS